jgi:hypothetical protein
MASDAEDFRMRAIYAGGLAHGALLRAKSDLLARNYEGSVRNVHEALEMLERVLFAGEKAEEGGG